MAAISKWLSIDKKIGGVFTLKKLIHHLRCSYVKIRKSYQFGYWRENSFDENKAFKVVLFALISQFISSTLKAMKKIRLAVIIIC